MPLLDRRGFLALLGVSAASLSAARVWVPDSGLVVLPRTMVLELARTCSFCGARGSTVASMVGLFKRPPRICEGCIWNSYAAIFEMPARLREAILPTPPARPTAPHL